MKFDNKKIVEAYLGNACPLVEPASFMMPGDDYLVLCGYDSRDVHHHGFEMLDQIIAEGQGWA